MTNKQAYAGLLETLLGPRVWCCIFEHEGEMRHGTTDAPIKAAEAISSLLKRVGELEGVNARQREALDWAKEHFAGELNTAAVAAIQSIESAALNSDAPLSTGGAL